MNAQSCNKPQTATAQQRSNGSCKLLLAPQFPASFAKAQNSPTSPEQDAICYCSLLFPCVLLTAAIAARSAPRVSFPAHLRPSFLSYSVHLLASSLPLSLVLTHSSLSSSLPLSSSLQPSLFLCLVSPPPTRKSQTQASSPLSLLRTPFLTVNAFTVHTPLIHCNLRLVRYFDRDQLEELHQSSPNQASSFPPHFHLFLHLISPADTDPPSHHAVTLNFANKLLVKVSEAMPRVKQETGSGSRPNIGRSMATPESILDAHSETPSEHVQRRRLIRSAARKSCACSPKQRAKNG